MTIRIIAVGDLVLGDSASTVGFGFNSTWSATGLEPALHDVTGILRSGDIVFGNLEAVLSDRDRDDRRAATLHMRGEPRFAADLNRCGFTVLNVANNHANQHGDAAFHDTCRHVREAGMMVCGLPGSDGWVTEPVVIDTGDEGKLGLLAYCLHPRQYYADRVPPFTEGTHDGIVADVRRLRGQVDAVVVSVHWGLEFTTDPSVEQVGLATAIIDAGGCLVLGHHSHVVGPFTRAGTSVVAYGLGNFVSDMLWDDRLRRGAILIADLAGGAIRNAEVVDTRLDARGAPTPAGRRPVEELPIPGVSSEANRMQAASETSRLRKAKARYLAANVRRMKPGYALQWIVKVIRNRLSFLL